LITLSAKPPDADYVGARVVCRRIVWCPSFWPFALP